MTIGEYIFGVGFKTDKSSEDKAKADIQGIKDFAQKVIGVLAVGVSIVKVGALMTEFGEINNQVSKINDGLMSNIEAADLMKESANDCYMTYQDMVTAVTSVRDASKDIFSDNQQVTSFVNLTTKAFKSAKANEAEIVALQDSMNKSFEAGTMQLETLEKMVSMAPDSVNILTESFGVSEEALEKMCKNGKISAQQMADAFINSADVINKNFEDVSLNVTDALKVIRNDFGSFVTDLNDSVKVTDRVSKLMLEGWKTVRNGMNAVRPILEKIIDGVLRVGKVIVTGFTKAGEFIGKVADKLGGMENLFKLLAIVAGAFFLAMNFTKIVAGIKMVLGVFKLLNPKLLLIIAIITLIVLVVEDFFNFMQGNDSLMGSIFESMGINADEVRDKIKAAWETVKSFLKSAWTFIVNLAKSIGGKLSAFWEENGTEIMATLSSIWENILTLLSGLWEIISTIAIAVFNGLSAFWDEWGSTIIGVFSILWETLISLIQPFLDFLDGLIQFLAGVFTGNWESAWEGIKTMVKAAIDFVKNIITGLKDAIKLIFGQIIDSAITWGKDFIDGLVSGIKGGIDKVKGAVTDVANTIKSFLHFSVPDEGPLTDYESWMPDFTDGLAKTLRANKGKVADAALGIADALNIKPTYKTALNAQGVNKAGNMVSQNVQIDNTFQVSERSMAGKASTAMKNSTDDVSRQLARGLAYGR
ncbi:MAG: tape measure protein [Lachnospiraceae bacterium]